MRREPGLLIVLAVAVTFLALSAGQARAGQDDIGVLCPDCKGSGRLEGVLDEEHRTVEATVIYCSVAMEEDPVGLGLDWRPCSKCRIPEARARAEKEFEVALLPRRAWLEARRKEVDERIRSDADHIQTEHFVLAWDLPKIKVAKKTVRRHAAIHLYAQRLEDLHRRILTLHGMTDEDTTGTMHAVYLFERRKTALALSPHVADRPLSHGSKVSLLGPRSAMVGWDDPTVVRDDKTRHQNVVHAVSHHIHDSIRDRTSWLFNRYGWAYEGLAHWFEIKDFGPPITWCSAEGGEFSHWKGKTWEANVKKAVLAGDQPVFQELITKSAGTLDAMEHQFAWSYIDYLIHLDAKKIHPMLRQMTGPQMPVRDILRDVYGLSVGQFVDGWTEYVKKEYSLKSATGNFRRR